MRRNIIFGPDNTSYYFTIFNTFQQDRPAGNKLPNSCRGRKPYTRGHFDPIDEFMSAREN
jgi:hypothetical protein